MDRIDTTTGAYHVHATSKFTDNCSQTKNKSINNQKCDLLALFASRSESLAAVGLGVSRLRSQHVSYNLIIVISTGDFQILWNVLSFVL